MKFRIQIATNEARIALSSFRGPWTRTSEFDQLAAHQMNFCALCCASCAKAFHCANAGTVKASIAQSAGVRRARFTFAICRSCSVYGGDGRRAAFRPRPQFAATECSLPDVCRVSFRTIPRRDSQEDRLAARHREYLASPMASHRHLLSIETGSQ